MENRGAFVEIRLGFASRWRGPIFVSPLWGDPVLAIAGQNNQRVQTLRLHVLTAVEAIIPVHPSFAGLVTANPRNSDTLGSPASTLTRVFPCVPQHGA
mgnify:FL=1